MICPTMAATDSENQAKVPPRSTPERILDAAEDLFAENGYSATSLGDVADRVERAKDEGFRVVTLLVLRQGDFQWGAVRLDHS